MKSSECGQVKAYSFGDVTFVDLAWVHVEHTL